MAAHGSCITADSNPLRSSAQTLCQLCLGLGICCCPHTALSIRLHLPGLSLRSLSKEVCQFEEYAVGFEQACAELGAEAPHEADRIQRFKAGLNSDIKFRCAARPDGSRWTSFRDFVRCCSLNWQVMQQNKVAKAENVENSAASGQSKRSGNNKQTQNTKPRALSVQASRNKRKRNPYLKKMVGKANGSGLSIPPEEMKRLMDEGRCLHCKQEGHFARECPTNPNAIQRKEKASKG